MEIGRKFIGLAEVQIWISLNLYIEGRKNDELEPKYRFGFAFLNI